MMSIGRPKTRSGSVRALRLFAAALLALGLFAVGLGPPVAAGAEGDAGGADRIVLDDGHVDLGPTWDDGTWALEVKDDTVQPPQWRPLDTVVWHVDDSARGTLPDDPFFAWLGSPGDEVWILPQAQQLGLLWPGWNTEHPEVATVGDDVAFELLGVDGPGPFLLFVSGTFGEPDVRWSSEQPSPDVFLVPPGAHAHGNWAFGAPGVYLLEVQVRATTADGEPLADRGTLAITVGVDDPSEALAQRLDALDGGQAPPPDEPGGDGSAPDAVEPEPGGDDASAAPTRPSDGDDATTTATDDVAETADEHDGGSSLLVVVVVVVLVVVAGGLLALRRRSTG